MTSAWQEETREFYASRGIGARVGLGDSPAVVVVDMTRAFTDPTHPVGADQTETLNGIQRLLAAARAANAPAFYTTLAFSQDASEAPTWARKMPALAELRIGDPVAMEIDPRIAPWEGELVFNRTAPSAFFGTGFVSMLVPRRVDTLIVAGCATSGCIRATVIDALSYGFRVGVPRECVGDRATGPHVANLFDMNAKYADVLSVEDVIRYLGAATTSPPGDEGTGA